jgi:hypothetical protein
MSHTIRSAESRSLPKVHAVVHSRVLAPLLGDEASFEDRLTWLRNEVGDQAARMSAIVNPVSHLQLVCTSMLSKVATGWENYRHDFLDAVTARSGKRPAGFLQAYQCAGWGYAIRFAAQHTDCRWLTLTIVDADLHELFSDEYEVNLGKIGYGVTTVALELPPRSLPPNCDGPLPNHGFTDMLHALRARRKETGAVSTFLPFMPPGLDGIARRSVGDCLAPNRHADYGHCFGADPWIGVIERLRAQAPTALECFTLGSFAFSGYYAIGSVQVGPWTWAELRNAPTSAGQSS